MKISLIARAVMVAMLAVSARGQAPAEGARREVKLNEGWQFHKGTVADGAAVAAADTGEGWEPVAVPHTWNAKDGQDGGGDFFRGESWYRRHVVVDAAMMGKSLYLRFEAINRKADIYVNGTLLGSHAGGQGAICMDATQALKPGDNLVAVRASNRVDQDMPPLQADFTFFGGIYRPVELVAVNALHIALNDFGSPGVYITTPQVTAGSANVAVRTIVENTIGGPGAHVSVQILDGERVIAEKTYGGDTLNAGSKWDSTTTLSVPNPHLWNGRADPFLYQVKVTVSATAGSLSPVQRVPTDSIIQPLGIRTMSVDPVKGFILNGKPYDLHGVNRHQESQDKGWALSEADHLRDMALIKELGCTGVRLAHYQHSQFFYDLCDKEGIVVWAEIPVVDKLGNTNSTFTDNARQQYTELIRQSFNHPSIAFWSAGNEVDENGGNFNRNGPPVYPWFKEMSALGHKEDPSRLTASAWREKFFPPPGTTDVIGLNEYLGWYTGGGPGNNSGWEGLEAYIPNHSDPAKGGIKGMWAMTEYGAGASIYFHSEKPVRMDHTEEYQALLHENTWKVFAKHPEIWGKFVWAMFDFAVDGRAEGDHSGINDKGLVTHDRQTRKDAFYFYKAVWSAEPTLCITSKRFTVRGLEKIPVKVYTNAAKVMLTVNGEALGEKSPENGTIVWENVALKEGKNVVVAAGVMGDGKKVEDTCTWTYTPGAPLEVYEAQDQRMKDAIKAGPPRAR